jgi:hypothetical protein
VARGGARPGAGRPSAAAKDEKAKRSAKTLAKCQEKIQSSLPELIDLMLQAARGGDTKALHFLVEMGLGKPATKQNVQADTEIKVVLGSIPRPRRNAEETGPDAEDDAGAALEEALEAEDEEAESGAAVDAL